MRIAMTMSNFPKYVEWIVFICDIYIKLFPLHGHIGYSYQWKGFLWPYLCIKRNITIDNSIKTDHLRYFSIFEYHQRRHFLWIYIASYLRINNKQTRAYLQVCLLDQNGAVQIWFYFDGVFVSQFELWANYIPNFYKALGIICYVVVWSPSWLFAIQIN